MMRRWLLIAAMCLAICPVARAEPEEPVRLIFPEQRHLELRGPSDFPPAGLPAIPTPPTVSAPQSNDALWNLSLDEAIHIALVNADVVRVLAGTTATTSGATIYDAPIANTQIDQARGRFDPTVQSQNTFSRTETPQGVFLNPATPMAPNNVRFGAAAVETFSSSTGVAKVFPSGGSAELGVNVNRASSDAVGLPLNPQTASNAQLTLTQPLLQGAGRPANLAPILIARIKTEQSFFVTKDSVQELVRGVVESYWNLVFAQTDTWARRQQVVQSGQALQRAEARLNAGLGNLTEVAQARVSLNNFQANLIGSEANLIQQEAVLRNLLGLAPADKRQIVPVTVPNSKRLPARWESIVALGEQYRPDIIEFKLIIEADQQQLVIARNTALPALNASALYRWNGLEGRTPDNQIISTGPNQFTDWQFGVNFSVPIGLRQPRAAMRQQELILARDRLNLQQGLHNAVHILAGNYRNLDQYYEQYQAYGQTRQAALVNVQRQMADYRAGRATLYINVLQAITDWGNAVSAESQALARYNTELSNLERQTGTILETHGVRFAEERYRSIGPLGRLFDGALYPQDLRPAPPAPHEAPQVLPPPKAQPAEPLSPLAQPGQTGRREIRPPGAEIVPPGIPLPPPQPLPPIRPR